MTPERIKEVAQGFCAGCNNSGKPCECQDYIDAINQALQEQQVEHDKLLEVIERKTTEAKNLAVEERKKIYEEIAHMVESEADRRYDREEEYVTDVLNGLANKIREGK